MHGCSSLQVLLLALCALCRAEGLNCVHDTGARCTTGLNRKQQQCAIAASDIPSFLCSAEQSTPSLPQLPEQPSTAVPHDIFAFSLDNVPPARAGDFARLQVSPAGGLAGSEAEHSGQHIAADGSGRQDKGMPGAEPASGVPSPAPFSSAAISSVELSDGAVHAPSAITEGLMDEGSADPCDHSDESDTDQLDLEAPAQRAPSQQLQTLAASVAASSSLDTADLLASSSDTSGRLPGGSTPTSKLKLTGTGTGTGMQQDTEPVHTRASVGAAQQAVQQHTGSLPAPTLRACATRKTAAGRPGLCSPSIADAHAHGDQKRDGAAEPTTPVLSARVTRASARASLAGEAASAADGLDAPSTAADGRSGCATGRRSPSKLMSGASASPEAVAAVAAAVPTPRTRARSLGAPILRATRADIEGAGARVGGVRQSIAMFESLYSKPANEDAGELQATPAPTPRRQSVSRLRRSKSIGGDLTPSRELKALLAERATAEVMGSKV